MAKKPSRRKPVLGKGKPAPKKPKFYFPVKFLRQARTLRKLLVPRLAKFFQTEIGAYYKFEKEAEQKRMQWLKERQKQDKENQAKTKPKIVEIESKGLPQALEKSVNLERQLGRLKKARQAFVNRKKLPREFAGKSAREIATLLKAVKEKTEAAIDRSMALKKERDRLRAQLNYPEKQFQAKVKALKEPYLRDLKLRALQEFGQDFKKAHLEEAINQLMQLVTQAKP